MLWVGETAGLRKRSARAVPCRRHRIGRALAFLAFLSGLGACAGPPQQASLPATAPPPPQPSFVNLYAPPGPPSDPWGPYIKEASARFTVPEKWIREVMRQESGSHQYLNGGLTTSPVGAMGLMQLMPVTYAEMRDRYGLGPDPYAPHDNIMAGTAYIGEMYARYGSPGFLAAYNAGPGRLDAYLVGGSRLPAETVGYLASVAPRLGDASVPTGPLARYAMVSASADDLNRRSLAGTLAIKTSNPATLVAQNKRGPIDESPLAAYAPAAGVSDARVVLASTGAGKTAPASIDGSWGVQVGAFSTQAQAEAAAAAAKERAPATLARARPAVAPASRPNGPTVYRAQLIGLSAEAAADACSRLAREHLGCLIVAPHRDT